MKRFLLFSALAVSLLTVSTKAQFVTIPDEDFRNYLMNAGFADCFVGDQMDTTCNEVVTAVKLNTYGFGNNIESLEGLQYFDNLDTFRHLTFTSNLETLPPRFPQLLRYLTVGSSGNNNPLSVMP